MAVPFGGTEPSQQMRAAAAYMFNMFAALCQAGFTEPQALQIVGNMQAAVITAMTSNPSAAVEAAKRQQPPMPPTT